MLHRFMVGKKGYIWWVAWRYLVARKQKKGLSFMTTISIFGVTIGVMSLTVVLSVMGGFEQDLRKKMFRGLPHMEIMSANPLAGFSLQELTLSKIKSLYPSAIGIEPFIQADVVIKKRRHVASVTLIGVSPDDGGRLWGFADGMVVGAISDLAKDHEGMLQGGDAFEKHPGIILGEDIALQLAADVGEIVTVLSPQMDMGDALAGQEFSASFVVCGIFKTDLPRYDSKYAVVSIPTARKFMADYDPYLQEKEYVSGVAVNFANPEEIGVFTDLLSRVPGVQAFTWKEANKSLLFALMLEKFTMGTILMLIVVVAAFSISGTMMMTVYHKRGQVALLRSLGMTRSGINRLFMFHGLVIGGFGVFFGMILGLGICAMLYYFQFIDLPEGVYFQSKLPVRFLPFEYLVICLSTGILSLVASIYPAMTAARQDPAQGLRFM